jgi:hypothetical protein
VDDAVRIGLAAARGKNLQVHSPTIGRQLLELGLIDEIDIHIVPVLLGDGVRLYDVPGGDIVYLDGAGADPTLVAHVRYRPIPLRLDTTVCDGTPGRRRDRSVPPPLWSGAEVVQVSGRRP